MIKEQQQAEQWYDVASWNQARVICVAQCVMFVSNHCFSHIVDIDAVLWMKKTTFGVICVCFQSLLVMFFSGHGRCCVHEPEMGAGMSCAAEGAKCIQGGKAGFAKG